MKKSKKQKQKKTYFQTLLLKAHEVLHIQVHTIQNHLVILLGRQHDELEGSLESTTGRNVQLLRQVTCSHDDAGVAGKTAANLVGIQDSARSFDQTPDFLYMNYQWELETKLIQSED